MNALFSAAGVSPSSLPECWLAIQWLKSHAERYSLDTQRIGVWVSTGGEHHLYTLASASDDALVSEVVFKDGPGAQWLSGAKAYFDQHLPDPNAPPAR